MKKALTIVKTTLFAATLCFSTASLMSQSATPAAANLTPTGSDSVAVRYKEACPDLQCEGGMWRCLGGRPHQACFTAFPID